MTSFTSDDMTTRVKVPPTAQNGLIKISWVMTEKILAVHTSALGQRICSSSMKALDVISRVAMPQQIAEIARPIALRHHVNELYLFGSMARGEGHADSDIDFIYQFDDTANPMIDEWALRDDLASTFGREIDLVKKRYITTELQDRLAEMQRVIFVNSITSNPMFRII